jgi:hypothetical protein
VTPQVFVRRLVLNSICDDGENVDQIILWDVSRETARCGLTIDRAEVVEALAQLVESRLAKEFLMSPWQPIKGMPPMDVVEENFNTYFFIAEKGKKVHLSDDSWYPFDDEGNLRPGWRLE